MITIWLLWTLVNGQVRDVDAFITKSQCEATVLERQALLREAVAAVSEDKKLELMKWTITGCTSVEVTPAHAS